MPRRPTKRQAMVMARMRDRGGPVRPAEVVGPNLYLPQTESAARGRLERLCNRGFAHRIPGRPAMYSLRNLTLELDGV